jgi:drug/metabolite transporter (DMT)-like permease
VFGALGILPLIVWRERGATLQSFRRLGRPGVMLVIASAASMTCFVASLGFTTVAHVYIVYATVPFVAAALAWLVLREAPSVGAVLAGFGALIGVMIMLGLSREGGWIGDAFAFGMTSAMAVMMVIGRSHPNLPVLQVTFLASLLSAACGAPFAGHAVPGGSDLLTLMAFGVTNSAVGVVFFTYGSQLLPPVETGLLSLLEVPLGPLWVWLALGETPSAATTVGGVVVFASVVIHTLVSTARGDGELGSVG